VPHPAPGVMAISKSPVAAVLMSDRQQIVYSAQLSVVTVYVVVLLLWFGVMSMVLPNVNCICASMHVLMWTVAYKFL
jgi:hypothetical protein